MEFNAKSKDQLLKELAVMRHRIAELEKEDTKRKRAEEAQQEVNRILQANIKYFKSMDTISKSTGRSVEVEEMIERVIKDVFVIFNPDRAWLLYPCDPDSPDCQIPYEYTNPEYPGGGELGTDIPLDNETKKVFRDILSTNEPVTYNLSNSSWAESFAVTRFSVKSQIATAIHLRIGKAWALGMHQCSYERVWTLDEKKLFQDISSRISDALGNLLLIRNVRKSKEDLQESEEKYRQLVSTSSDAIMIFDAETKQFIDVNKACEYLYGYSRDEFLELRHDDITNEPEASKDSIDKSLKEAIDKIPLRYHRKKDRTVFPVEISVSNFEIRGRRVLCGVIRDITERKQFEEEKQKFHKLESIGILAGGIAHDFNNLLSGLLNNVYLLKMNIDSESKEYKNLESAEKAINRATSLTHQLLTFARGGAPVKKTASIIELIKESTEFALKGSNVKCEYIVADNLWPVEVDEGQMNQVIHNLILNADQSMPAGGTIQISTENSNLGSYTGLPLQEGRHVKIVIQDQGIGIEKERLQKIFDPYFTTKEAGRGLGLSISYSIVKNHDGHISVESEIGTGTTFTIFLPASEKQIEENKNAGNTFIMGQGKILLMDDEEFIRESIGAFLTMSGYETECAEDGDKAVNLYQKAMETSKPFDAVILDLTIRGGVGGKEAMKKLLDIDPNVKAIVSSGYSSDPVMAKFREYGFRDVLAKPCRSPKELSEILQRVLKA